MKASNMIVAGTFSGGELEPGTFHQPVPQEFRAGAQVQAWPSVEKHKANRDVARNTPNSGSVSAATPIDEEEVPSPRG